MVYLYESIPELIESYTEYLQTEKANGKKLLGFFTHEFIPYELLRALNIIPVPLIWAGDESRVSAGSDYLTPTMCPFALSQIGSFLLKEENNRYRFLCLLDGIVATNYCAADMFVNEWIRDLNQLPCFTLHIPFLKESHHIQFYRSDLVRFTKELENFTGLSVDPIKLSNEIKLSNSWKAELQKILVTNLIGSQKNKIIQQFQLFGITGPADWNLKSIIAYQNSISNLSSPKLRNIILAGSSVFIGDDLYSFIEECGGNVIFDATWLGLSSTLFQTSIKLSDNPDISLDQLFDYFANQFSSNQISLHNAPNSPENYVDFLYNITQKIKVNAIIYHILKFCDITGHHRVYIKDMLIQKGLQCLTLERDYSASMSGQIRTRIEAFFEML